MVEDVFGLGRAFSGISRKKGNNVHVKLGTYNFFIMRHGQSVGQIDINAYRSPGDPLIPLTSWGRQQGHEAGDSLRAYALQNDLADFEVWRGTCTRTDQTATNVIEGLGEDLIIGNRSDIRLDKQIFGIFSGIFDDAEKAARYPAEYAAYKKQLEELGLYQARPPGGESLADVDAKAEDFIRSIMSHPSKAVRNIIIITHGTPALCLEKALTHQTSDWLINNIDRSQNCSIKLVENTSGKFNAEEIGFGLPAPSPASALQPRTALFEANA